MWHFMYSSESFGNVAFYVQLRIIWQYGILSTAQNHLAMWHFKYSSESFGNVAFYVQLRIYREHHLATV